MPGFYTRAMAQAQCVLTRTRTRNPLYTVLPEDTFGISKVLPDYVVETALHRDGQSSMKIEISHYYSTPTLKAKLLNLIARQKIARDTQDTLNGMKAAIEERGATIKNG